MSLTPLQQNLDINSKTTLKWVEHIEQVTQLTEDKSHGNRWQSEDGSTDKHRQKKYLWSAEIDTIYTVHVQKYMI